MAEQAITPEAKVYADEATSIRHLAEVVTEIDARNELLRIAALYERLARLVDELTR